MMLSTLRRTVALAAVPALLATVTATAPAASATDSYLSRTTGFVGTAQWTQYYDFPNDNDAFGNVHVGYLNAFETATGVADVFAFIDDFSCPPGVYPGGHGEPNGCTYVGARQLQGQGVPFTVARKVASATLKGTLTASTAGDPHSGEGGTTLGQAPADFTWTAVSSPTRTRSTYRYSDGTATYSETYTSTSRRTTMSGRLGPMLFEEAYQQSGSLESFKSTTRFRG